MVQDKYVPYLQWIDKEHEAMVALLTEWANINTYPSNLEGLKRMKNTLEDSFGRLGGTMQDIPLEAEEQTFGHALSIRKRPEAPIQIFLGGHMDTVFPKTSSFQKAKKKEDDLLVGPGVADMKGGIMVLFKALQALERSPFAEEIGWEVFLDTEEEIGSPASKAFFQGIAKRNQLGLIFEPALPNGDLVTERKGSMVLTATAKGKAAHVGRDFASGENAIVRLTRWLQRVEKIKENHPQVILNVGTIQGGITANVVPPFAETTINIRSDTEKEFSIIEKELEESAKAEKISLQINSYRPPKPLDDKTRSLFAHLQKCGSELDIPLHSQKSGGVCDGNNLASFGLPTMDTLGVVGGNLHTEEEFVRLSSITERTKVCALFLMKLGGKEIAIR